MNIPIFKSIVWKLLPFDSYFPNLNLQKGDEFDWFLMSIDDGFLSEYIYPQSRKSLSKWADAENISNYSIEEQSYGDAAPLVIRVIK